MSRRSAFVLAAGTVAAIASVVLAAVITLGAPAVAGSEHPGSHAKPRVRTVTRTVTIHRPGDASAVTTSGGIATVSTATTTSAPSEGTYADGEDGLSDEQADEGSLVGDGSEGSGAEVHDD